MYYFFITKKKRKKFLKEYSRVRKAMADGKTPVYSEMRNQRTALLELVPYTSINAVFLICSTYLISLIKIPEIIKIAVVLIINSASSTLAYCLFVFIKNWFRKRLLKKLGIKPTENAIAVLESLEYQSVG